MNRHLRMISTACTAAILSTNLCLLPALALHASIGAVAGAKKLQDGMNQGKDQELTFSPLLLQMAKLIGRTGLPQGFFLENDSPFPDEQGVDLRTLLLYQAGLIKMPVRLQGSRKSNPRQQDFVPTLQVPRIPEIAKEMDREAPAKPNSWPSLASEPLPREPESTQVIEPRANVGEPHKISIALSKPGGSQPEREPMLLFDVAQLQADLDHKDGGPTQVHADIPRLAMMMPRTNTMPFITKNSFRLWTYRPEARGLELRGVEQVDGNTTSFNGTFVVATPGVIKSITGRHFDMSPGRLLASNQGGELLFATGLGTVSIEPQATAIVEVTRAESGALTVRVFALEANIGRSVAVTIPGAKPKIIKLDKGEVLVIGDHQLVDSDFAGSHIANKNKLDDKTTRGTFPVAQYSDNDLMLKSDAHTKQNTERFAAVSELKRRLNDR